MRDSNHVSRLLPTCYPEASRLFVPLDFLAFMSDGNQIQSECRDYRTRLCLTRRCHFGCYVC